jgi:hypothetical protein
MEFSFDFSKYVKCSSSSSTVYFNFKMTSYLKIQIEVEDCLEKNFGDIETAFKEAKHDKSPFCGLN